MNIHARGGKKLIRNINAFGLNPSPWIKPQQIDQIIKGPVILVKPPIFCPNCCGSHIRKPKQKAANNREKKQKYE